MDEKKPSVEDVIEHIRKELGMDKFDEATDKLYKQLSEESVVYIEKMTRASFHCRLTDRRTGEVMVISSKVPLVPWIVQSILGIQDTHIVEPMTDEEYQAFVEDMEE